jgi:hypothetical protein
MSSTLETVLELALIAFAFVSVAIVLFVIVDIVFALGVMAVTRWRDRSGIFDVFKDDGGA